MDCSVYEIGQSATVIRVDVCLLRYCPVVKGILQTRVSGKGFPKNRLVVKPRPGDRGKHHCA